MATVGRLVGAKVLTTLLAPSAFGALALAQGVATLANNFFCAPIVHAAIRFRPDAVRDDRIREFRQVLGRLIAGRIVWAVVALLAGGAIWIYGLRRGGSYALFAVLGLFVAVEVMRQLESSLLNAARRQGRFAAWEASDAWAKPAGATAAIAVAGPTATAAMAGIAGATAAVLAGFRRREPAPVGHAPDGPWAERCRRGILAFANPMMPLAILGWLMSYADRYLVGGLTSISEAGVYAAAYGLGSQPFVAFAGVVHASLRPVLFDAVARGETARARKALLTWFLVIGGGSAIGVAVVALAARLLVSLFLGPEFSAGARLLPWIAGAYAVQNVQQVFESVIYARRRTRVLIVMQGIGTVTALSLYLVLIPRLGALGAAMASLFALVASCIAAGVLSQIHRPWAAR